MKRIYIIILIICISINYIGNGYDVKAESTSQTQTVYVDGIEYEYYLDNYGNFHLETVDGYAELVLNNSSVAEIEIGDENYCAEFETLTSDDIDAVVYDEEGDIIEEYNDINEVVDDGYEGQFLISLTAISVGTLIEVVVCLAVTTVIYGALRYAASAIAKDKKKQGLIYKAYLDPSSGNVYVDKKNTISASDAIARIKAGNNIYTYLKHNASYIVGCTGLGIAGPEITAKKNMKNGCTYFYHYHTAGRNGAHAWYGNPHTK